MTKPLERKLYMFWTGNNQPSEPRRRAIEEARRTCGVDFVLKVGNEVLDLQLPEHPFHEAYPHLSLTHKADYLRTYVMHHHGGGYSDVKLLDFDWNPYFDALDASDAWAMGYPETRPIDVAVVPNDPIARELQSNYASLIGNCNYIFKPGTPFTEQWYRSMHSKLDEKLLELRENPARHPQDVKGARFSDGTVSKYPLRWAEILGEIFHKVCYAHRNQILLNLPKYVKVDNYR
jgi:hypothetical protein